MALVEKNDVTLEAEDRARHSLAARYSSEFAHLVSYYTSLIHDERDTDSGPALSSMEVGQTYPVSPRWLYRHYHDAHLIVRDPVTGKAGRIIDVQRQHADSARYQIWVRMPGKTGKFFGHEGTDTFDISLLEPPH